MELIYKALAKYYDLLFQDKDYQGEAEFIKKIVRKRRPYAKSILDIGCGTGTHLNLLLDDFELLYGVDLNPEVIEEAKKKSSRVKYVIGGMTDFKIEKKFDVVICLFSVFNYNLSLDEAQKTLENIKKHLNKKGLAIFALYTPNNTEKKIRIHIGKDENTEVAKINQYIFDPKTHLETTDFLVLIKNKKGVDFFTETGHQYRIYQIKEFSDMLRRTSFTNIEVFDDFTNQSASSITTYPVFAASLK